MTPAPIAGSVVDVRLHNGRTVRGEICSAYDTISGKKYRVLSGSLCVEITPDQIVRVLGKAETK